MRRPSGRSRLRTASLLVLLALASTGHAPAQIGGAALASDHRLVGTIEGGAFAGAVLTDPSGEQKFYRLNDLLPNGSRLYRLRSDGILIKQPDGSVSEVFVYRELTTAVPVRAEPVASPKPSTKSDPPPRRQRPVRHKSPMYEEDER